MTLKKLSLKGYRIEDYHATYTGGCNMNVKDQKIIACLRQNARMPLTIMSRKIRVPVSTIFDRLKMNENEVVQKHTCLLDFPKLGYFARANIALKVERDDKEILKEHLVKHHSINSVYKINNGFDFMVEGVFKQVKDMEDFLDSLEQRFKIVDKKSFFIIDDLKRESFMSNPDIVF